MSLLGHIDLHHISCLNITPKDLVLTHSMTESWGQWNKWNKKVPGAQNKREEVGPLGNAGGAGIPEQAGLQHTTKDQTNSRFLEGAKVGKSMHETSSSAGTLGFAAKVPDE